MMNLDGKLLLSLDIETNGLPPGDVRLVEIGVCGFRVSSCQGADIEFVSEFDFCKRVRLPEHVHMSEEATAVNGITDDEAHEVGDDAADVLNSLAEFFRLVQYRTGLILVGHNIKKFDMPVLYHAAAHVDYELPQKLFDVINLAPSRIFDTKQIYAAFLSGEKVDSMPASKMRDVPCTLDSLPGSDNVTAHSAMDDARSCAKAFNCMYQGGVLDLVY